MYRFFRSLLNFLGGSISRAFGTALVVALFFIIFGVAPWELIVRLIAEPPAWLLNGWLRLGALFFGLAIIAVALRYNIWDRQQIAVDDLAEDMSFAISNLLNRSRPDPLDDGWITQWETDFHTWCNQVSAKLDNRAFFTRADQLHFDRLGFVPPVRMSGHERYDWLLAQLRLKLERLRNVINWSQQRRR